MTIHRVLSTTIYLCFCFLLFFIFCLIWIKFVLKLIQNKYSKFFQKNKIIQKYINFHNKNNALQKNVLYKLVSYKLDDKNIYKQTPCRNHVSFYYLKRTIFFLHNSKFMPIKQRLNEFFIQNDITDIRNFTHLTYEKVIQFKKDMSICLIEAYNSFDYKNRKELLYIYFKLYSKLYFLFKNENTYFFHFLTNIILVSWVYTPFNVIFYYKEKKKMNK
ncbi:conserved protein, unknown function [Hepatocystis sp. ex Piliocolobus tephrosceles]|nr:conserved protein, unknown function [Hepatocystis sp. ex Piliocolobus tephrosceles]